MHVKRFKYHKKQLLQNVPLNATYCDTEDHIWLQFKFINELKYIIPTLKL